MQPRNERQTAHKSRNQVERVELKRVRAATAGVMQVWEGGKASRVRVVQ